MKLGVQLFGCSREFRKDPDAFFDALQEMGYTQVEPCVLFGDFPAFTGLLWSPEEVPVFRRAMEARGLVLHSVHAFCTDIHAYAAQMKQLAAENGIGAYVFNLTDAARADVLPFVRTMDDLAEQLQEVGCEVWLHNVQGDFVQRGNCSPFEAALAAGRHLYAQIDTGWAMFDGRDPAALIALPETKLHGLHLKELAYDFRHKSGDEIFAVLGEGVTKLVDVLTQAGDVRIVIDPDVTANTFLDDFRQSYQAVTAADPEDRENDISILEVYDVENRTRTVLAEFDHLIEAPNWSMDGTFLVYNSRGHIFKYILETGESIEIDTGMAIHCNNDHVLSADGRQLAVSHSSQGWFSQVYILPIEGGTPRLVTPNAPSFLHGWSPDGRTLAYCAFRDAERGGDIYTIPAEGGDEVQLTDALGLNDGPEYSPDGQYIWFNSVRTGLMQAWRMKADGSEQTQMTFDEHLNTWFPHVSPDGKQVVMVSYRKGDLEPGEHLPHKNVELRLMPAEGGTPETLLEIFGGQGTINVNSWSPDSKRFAFVSYRRRK